MAKKKKNRTNLNDLATANAESKVRYGPKQTALAGLLSEAQGNYASDVTAAKAGAKSSIVHARNARKPLAAIYDEATGAADSAASDVATAFGGLGAAADPFRAATAREQGAAKTRLATSKASALSELSDRKTEATVGRQFALTNAKTEFRSNMSQLASQLAALGDEQGAYVAGRIGALGESRANRQNQRQIQKISGTNASKLEDQRHGNRLTEQAAKDAAKAKKDKKKGPDPASRAERRDFESQFNKALRYASAYADPNKPGGVTSRTQAADDLITGRPAWKDDKDELHSAIPAITDQAALSAALDMAYNKSISGANAKRIRKLGIKPGQLSGAVTPADLRAERMRRRRAGDKAVNQSPGGDVNQR